MFQRLLIVLVLLLPLPVLAQTTNSRTFSGAGTAITATGSALDINVASGSVAITGSVTVTGGLTDTQLRASAVPISGTVTAIQGTAANLNAAVVGTGTAGSPSGNILTVQGVASMTKLLVTPDPVALPANQTVTLKTTIGDPIGTLQNPLIVGSAKIQSYNSGFVDAGTQRVELPFNGQGQVRLAAGSQTVGAVTGNQADNSLSVGKRLATMPATANAVSPTWTEGNQAPISVDTFGSQRTRMMDQYGKTLGTPNNPITISISPALLTSSKTFGLPASVGAQTTPTTVAVLANNGALRGITGAAPGDYGMVVHPSVAPAMQCPYVKNISVTASTQLVTNGGGQNIHVCSFSVVLAGAESVSLVEGTGSVCATGTTGLYGGTSASAAFAANGGVAMTSDRITIPMQVLGDNLCLLKSSANNASGMLSYGLY